MQYLRSAMQSLRSWVKERHQGVPEPKAELRLGLVLKISSGGELKRFSKEEVSARIVPNRRVDTLVLKLDPMPKRGDYTNKI